MPAFSYRALDTVGRTQKGVIEAGNLTAARYALRDRALLPIAVDPAHSREIASTSDTSAQRNWSQRFRRRAVSAQHLSVATRQLSTLVGSDVRIEDALRLVAGQNEGARLDGILLDVRSKVLEGASLARGLARHPAVFPDYYVASIHAGEQSGRLGEVLAYLADFVESRNVAGRKLKLALLYPALLATISVLMMVLMMVYVVPDIVRVFVSRGADLPLLTRALIAFSNFVNSYGLVVLAMLAVGFVLGRRELAKPERRLAFDKALATREPFARFSRKLNAARFSATLATLVQSAVPLLDALNAAAAVVPNRHVRKRMEEVAARVREGDSVSRSMREAAVLPGMLTAIVASGEASGKLGPALERASGELDREVEAQLQVLVSLVEPMVLLAMGGMVLLMVMAILMPIIGLNDLAIS
ncbi:MAG: type II secretion system F family protein [Parerythrobacter sp.]